MVISVLLVLVGLASAIYISIGMVSAFAPQLYRNNSGTTSGNQIPSELELVGAIACLFYGLVGIWVLQELRRKSQTALLLVQTLATLNIIFGFFRFPLGLIFILANVSALVLASSNSAKCWVAKS